MTLQRSITNDPEQARSQLLIDTVRQAREAAERGEWAKVRRLINLSLEIVRDMPKKNAAKSSP